MPFRLVLFDLDGTLLDTLQDLAESTNAVLERAGHPPHPLDAYRHMVGEGIRTLARRALPAPARDAETVARTVDAMREEYGRRWRRHTRPYPGVDRMLDGLAARGLPAAVVSNKPQDFTRLTVDTLLPGRTFAAVVGAREGVPLKPDPRGTLEVAASLGAPPGACLFCGDTRTDVETALAAGMVPVGALWGFRDRDELEGAGARHLIAAPADLLDLV